MEPLATLSTALTVTKTLRDLVKGDKPNMDEIRSATVALQDSLIDLQGSVLAGQEEREAALTADKRRRRAISFDSPWRVAPSSPAARETLPCRPRASRTIVRSRSSRASASVRRRSAATVFRKAGRGRRGRSGVR